MTVLTVAGPEEAGTVRAPVRACAEALTGAGIRVSTVTATTDREVDDVLAGLDGPPRPDHLPWPDPAGATRLVVAAASDARFAAVLRRMVRRWAPPPSRRPADLPEGRTVPDLPPVGVLPLGPAGRNTADLVTQLGLARDPAVVARAVRDGRVRRLDLLRQDGGGVTLDGALLGGSDQSGRAATWRGRVEVDDAVLSPGDEPLLAGVVANAGGWIRPDGLPMVVDPDPTDGRLRVAVALAVRGRWRRRLRVEVRRASGRAVTVRPPEPVPYLDDGEPGLLTRQRSWWVEPAAWAVYTP